MGNVRPTFGRYELVGELAEGGMGKIYLARQSGIEGFSRLCVLKRMRGDIADGDLATLLIDEARIAANLNHPNIATIYDFGRHDGELFLSMEYVPGPNLDAIVKRAREVGEPLDGDLAVQIVAEVARGLAYAHDARDAHGRPLTVVHRDISPQNVLVSMHGEVKVTDFGIAKAVGKLHRSVTGEVRGKIQYMSPEQLAGATVDRRADIFALGVMLWELVCGRYLFSGRTVDEIIGQRLTRPIPDPRTVRPDLSPPLASAIMGALADLDRRTPSAAVLADQLRACSGALDRDALGGLVQRLFPDIDELGPSAPGASPVGSGADTALAPGMAIGEFEIVGILGEGGIGVVYDAVNPMIGKRAAIKVLRRRFASDDQAVSRFLHEARAVNEIDHPNIVDIFGFGTLPDGRPYCAMDRLDGETLGAALKRGPMPPDAGLAILEAVADAVDAAHRRNIVHRDLKPDNVFLTRGSGVKVLDFGLAKLDSASVTATQTGIPLGTPMYMSPEQASGAAIDGRTDVYSFGVLAYRTLTGHHPFSGERPVDALAARFAVAPTAPSSVGLPSELDKPILKCLAVNPAERFATAGEACAAMRAAVTRSKQRSRGRTALLVAAIAAVLLAGGATALALGSGGGDSTPPGQTIAAGDHHAADASAPPQPSQTSVEALDAGAPRAPDLDPTPAADNADSADRPIKDDRPAPEPAVTGKPAPRSGAGPFLERRRALKKSLAAALKRHLSRECKRRGLPEMPPSVEVIMTFPGPGIARPILHRPRMLELCMLEVIRDSQITDAEIGWKPTLYLTFPRPTDRGAGAAAGQVVALSFKRDVQRLLQNVVDTNCALDGDGPSGVMTLSFETDQAVRVRNARLSKPGPRAFARCVAQQVVRNVRLAASTKFSWRLAIAKGRAQIQRERRAAP